MAGGSTHWRGRSVISKVVSLLDAFTPATPELSLGELARITGLPVSTTYRLACELLEWGGLERAEGAGYRVGRRIRELGVLATRGVALREVALPFMRDLHEATDESVHLAVRDGLEAVCVEAVEGAAPGHTRRCGRLPLHATAVGKVLLAHGPPEVLTAVLAPGLPRYTPFTVVAGGHLRRQLAEVRRNGTAYAREEMAPGWVSVACPVFDADQSVAAALAVVPCPGRRDVRRLAAAVRTAATSTSRAIRERGGLTVGS